MAFIDGNNLDAGRSGFGLGCGSGCPCASCRRSAQRLGESYETDADDDEASPRAAPAPATRLGEDAAPAPAGAAMPSDAMARLRDTLRRGGVPMALEQLLREGVRGEGRLTDLLFLARHPERQGRRVAPDEAGAAQEWRALRERLVRPRLHGPRAAAASSPRRTASAGTTQVSRPQVTGACPIEDPLPQLRHPTGQPCSRGARKCWPAAGRSLDLVDADLPCAAERDAATYRAVLRYFNVADARNARYAPEPGKTFCNIFAHDVTRALRASIPHWVRDEQQRTTRPIGWRELNASATFRWLARVGPSAGWHPIDAALIASIRGLPQRRGPNGGVVPVSAGRVLDAALARLPPPLAEAATRIARATHAEPGLLAQDAYVAQQFANLGLPTVVSWAHPDPRRSGHIALIAPEAPGSTGVRTRSGAFVPRSTQAGRICFEERPADWVARPAFSSRRFFVHA